jgi:S-adenosylmethionine/arginine decarboxylase-like enzyme
VSCEHLFVDMSGVTPSRLTDPQDLGALALAAANAAGLHPAAPPIVQASPRGTSAVLACHGGHVAMHALPDEGLCYADVASVGAAHSERALDVIVRRLAPRDIRTETAGRRREPTPAHRERP